MLYNKFNALSIKILQDMLSGVFPVSIRKPRCIVFQYLLVFNCIDLEGLDLLLDTSYYFLNKQYPHLDNRKCNEKTASEFAYRNTKNGLLSHFLEKEKDYYTLTQLAIKEHISFLENTNYYVPDLYLDYIYSLTDELRNIFVSSHAANSGVHIFKFLLGSSFHAFHQSLNTPLNYNGMNYNSFSQRENVLKADASMFIDEPYRAFFFFENDMYFETKNQIYTKFERYLVLAASSEFNIAECCIHFTLGALDYMGTKYAKKVIPSRVSINQYRLIFCSYCLGNNLSIDEIYELTFDSFNMPENDILLSFSNISESLLAAFQFINELKLYFPGTSKILSILDYNHLKNTFFVSDSLFNTSCSVDYYKRREKLFEWSNHCSIAKFFNYGLRLTISDNNSCMNDINYCYPALISDEYNLFTRFMYQYINDNIGALSLDLEYIVSKNILSKEMSHIASFDNNTYVLANYFFVEEQGISYQFSFENISNDFSARKRVELLLNNKVNLAMNDLVLVICYEQEPYSMAYIHSLENKYADTIFNTNIYFLNLTKGV